MSRPAPCELALVFLLAVSLARATPVRAEDASPPAPDVAPTYADHPAEWWVDQLERPPGEQVARLVLRRMGSAAVPALAAAAFDRRSAVRREVWALLVEIARRRGDLSAAADMLGRAVDDPDPEVRRQAGQVLASAPPMNPSDTDGAIALLRSPDAQTRANTLFFLKSRATLDDAVVDAIGACLLDPSEFVVESALRTLLEAAPKTPRVAEVALRARGRVPPGQRRALLFVLGRARPVRDDVLDALDAEARGPLEAAPAAGALAAAAKDARPALDRLAALVAKAPADATRDAAAEAFGSLGEAAAPALPAVAPCLRDARGPVRDGVAQAIRASRAAAGPVIPEVMASCEQGQPGWMLLDQLAPVLAREIVAAFPAAPPQGQAAAVSVLDRQTDAVLAPVAEALHAALADHLSTMTARPVEAPPTVQLMAHLALAEPSLAPAVAADWHGFLKRVPWKDPEGRANLGGYAISQGVRRNPRAFPVVADAFLRAANDEGFPLESRVQFYRLSVGPPDTPGQRARLLKDLDHPVPEIAEAAGASLWGDPGAIPELLGRAADPRAEARLRVARVLLVFVVTTKLAPAQEKTLLALVRDDPDPRVRATTACVLLAQWSPLPNDLRLPDDVDRAAFARALSDGLSTDDPGVRSLSAWRIRAFPAQAADALPALRRMAQGTDAPLAQVARESIDAIEAATKEK